MSERIRDLHSSLLRVLVRVDALAHAIRFAIELTLVLLREMAVVFRHISLLVVLQALLAAFHAGGLSRPQLAILYAVRNAILLSGFTPVHLIHSRMPWINVARAGA
jgi:hypothetical protein